MLNIISELKHVMQTHLEVRRVAREMMAAMPAHIQTQTAAWGTWLWLAELIFSCLLLVLWRVKGLKEWEADRPEQGHDWKVED